MFLCNLKHENNTKIMEDKQIHHQDKFQELSVTHMYITHEQVTIE